MLNFKEYTNQCLCELNKTAKYYQKNPDKIKDISYNSEDFDSYNNQLYNIITRKNLNFKKLHNDAYKLFELHELDLIKIFCKNAKDTINLKSFMWVCDSDVDVPIEYRYLIPVRDKLIAVNRYYYNYLSKLGIHKGRIHTKSCNNCIGYIIEMA